jgi:hypothetical protein
VEQQGGRFLKRDKQSGAWIRVTYKPAVDKTSQGLREGDREEDPGRQTFEHEIDPSAVPDSSSGQKANPNLGDLTEGAGPPGRSGERCNADEQARQTAPIHTPHLNDVLCVQGGGHAFNIQFRAWGLERKTNYHLASNEKKARLTREVIALVKNQNPPGRFLQRDSTHAGWWIEADDGRVSRKIQKLFRLVDTKTVAARCEELEEETERRGKEEFQRPEKRVRFDDIAKVCEPPIDETTPARGVGELLCNAEDQVRQPGKELGETEDGVASVSTLDSYDVLFEQDGRHAENVHASPRATRGIVATVGPTRVDPSPIPPEFTAVQQPRAYSSQHNTTILKLESMSKEMQTWARLVECTEGATQLGCIEKVSRLSQEMQKERLKLDELSSF